MDLIEAPRIVERPELSCLGIRTVTPFRGMLHERDVLLNELIDWLDDNKAEKLGEFFVRLHVIDMNGPMDLEVGVVTPEPIPGSGRVRPSTFPAGRYATLTYRNHSLRANRALIEWAREQGIPFDRWDEEAGDHFACRYEAYRTDPRTEPRKTKWEVELNIRVAD
jgi:effector-binding domain-containing protein